MEQDLKPQTYYLRADQIKEISAVAARRQLRDGEKVSLSEIAREVIDAGLAVLAPVVITKPVEPMATP